MSITNPHKDAPIPHGRSVVSCKKLLNRLKEKHKDDIQKIKDNKPFNAPADGSAPATPSKPKTPRKRKTKADAEGSCGEESPKKKAAGGGRKKKDEAATVKEEVKVEEEGEDEIQV
jgi:hypothetical protein